MTKNKPAVSTKAYSNAGFLQSKDARALRILAEYLEPKSRFDHHKIDDTIVFMGSARTLSKVDAEKALAEAERRDGDVARAPPHSMPTWQDRSAQIGRAHV